MEESQWNHRGESYSAWGKEAGVDAFWAGIWKVSRRFLDWDEWEGHSREVAIT